MLCIAGEPWAGKHGNQRLLSSCTTVGMLWEELAELSVGF